MVYVRYFQVVYESSTVISMSNEAANETVRTTMVTFLKFSQFRFW